MGAKNEEAKEWLSSCLDASIFGMVIKDKDLLRYIGYCVKLMADDIMVGYNNHRRWRHGGLWVLAQMKKGRFFLSVEDWHEQVQINLGPNVGDMTIRYDPPRRGQVIPMVVRQYKAHEDIEDGGSQARAQGPRAT